MDRVQAMIDGVQDSAPASWVMLIAAALVAAVSCSRWRTAAGIAGSLLLFAGLELGRFDGEPHLTDKIDATSFFWAEAVTLRLVTGAVALIVAAPIGLTAAPAVGVVRASIAGALVVGPLGVAMLWSSISLLLGLHAEPAETVRLTIDDSQNILSGGACLSILAAATASYCLLTAKPTGRHQPPA